VAPLPPAASPALLPVQASIAAVPTNVAHSMAARLFVVIHPSGSELSIC